MFTTWNVLPASGNFTSPFKITLSNIFRLIVLVKRKITLITEFVLIRRTSRVFVLKVESEVISGSIPRIGHETLRKEMRVIQYSGCVVLGFANDGVDLRNVWVRVSSLKTVRACDALGSIGSALLPRVACVLNDGLTPFM